MQVLGTERSILDQLNAAVVVTDLDGLITLWNPQADVLFGWPAEDALGRNILDLLAAPDDSRRVATILRTVAGGRGWSGELTLTRRDGTAVDVQAANSPVVDERGRTSGMIAISFDITNRRRAEQRLALQYRVTAVLAESETLAEAGPRVLRAVCETAGWLHGTLWTVNEASGRLVCSEIWQSDPDRLREFAETSLEREFPPGVGLPGRVWSSGQAAWVPDVLEDPTFQRAAAARVGLHACLAVPVTVQDEVTGVIEFFAAEIREPDEDLLRMLAGIGGQIGQLMERKEAERAVRESDARKTAILETSVDAVVSIDAEGRILEFNPAAERMFGRSREDVMGQDMASLLIPPSLRPKHREAFARHLRTSEARIIGRRYELDGLRADGTEFPAELSVTRVQLPGSPMFTAFVRDISERRKAEVEVERMLAAEQRARAQAEAAQQRLAFLAEAGTLLASALDFGSALEALGGLAVSLLADICLIDVLDESDELQRMVAVHADPAKEELTRQLQGRYAPVRGGPHPAARVVETGRPEFSPEMTEEFLRRTTRDAEHFRITQELGMQSYVCVPLIARGRTLGTITLVSTNPARRYGPADVTLAEDLARRAALTIDNARLFEAEQRARLAAERAAERTAALQEVTAALSEAVSSWQVAEVVLARAVGLLGASAGLMAMLRQDRELEIIGHIGYPQSLIDQWNTVSLDAPLPISEAVRTGDPVFLGSLAEVTERYPEVGARSLPISESWAIVPMMGERRAVGALSLGFSQPKSFSDEDRAFLEALGRQAAHAFERTRLYEAEMKSRAEAEAARQQLALLAEASTVLAAGVIDFEHTLSTVARLAVPDFADWCVVDIVGERGGIDQIAIAHIDPEKEWLGWEYRERYPPNPDAPIGVPVVLRTGRAEIYPEITEEMYRRVSRDERQFELLKTLRPVSSMIVPLVARGRILGAMTFAWAESDRRYGPDDLLLAEDLARRAALALDNARLYRERSSVARTLQQSLLPPRLPPIPGLELAALYRPAGEGSEIGGDFYDLFETPDRGWVAAIGDVCGKGVDAAAVTGLARYTLRAVAMREQRPSVILETLNEALIQQTPNDRFCTVCLAKIRLDGEAIGLTVCSGGHPLPLILRQDGTVETAGEPGTLLGVFAEAALPDTDVVLRRGDALVLYTDGVVEERIQRDVFGEDRLLEALASARGLSAEAVAATLGDAVHSFRPEAPRDDMAILVLKVVA